MPSAKNLAVALIGILLAAGLTATTSPVSAAAAAGATSATVSGHDGVRFTTCFPYQYRYSIDTGEYGEWDAEATFRGPNGIRLGVDYLYRGSDETSGTSTEPICPQDPVGRWSIQLDVTFYDTEGNVAGSAETTDTFRLRKPRTRTSYTVDDLTPRYHQFLTFRVVSKIEGPKGYLPNRYQYVALQARHAGGWQRIRGSAERVDRRGVAIMRARWERRAPLDIRAITPVASGYAGSASRPKTLG